MGAGGRRRLQRRGGCVDCQGESCRLQDHRCSRAGGKEHPDQSGILRGRSRHGPGMQEPLLLDQSRRGRTTAHTGCSETGVFEIGSDTREIGLGKLGLPYASQRDGRRVPLGHPATSLRVGGCGHLGNIARTERCGGPNVGAGALRGESNNPRTVESADDRRARWEAGEAIAPTTPRAPFGRARTA